MGRNGKKTKTTLFFFNFTAVNLLDKYAYWLVTIRVLNYKCSINNLHIFKSSILKIFTALR